MSSLRTAAMAHRSSFVGFAAISAARAGSISTVSRPYRRGLASSASNSSEPNSKAKSKVNDAPIPTPTPLYPPANNPFADVRRQQQQQQQQSQSPSAEVEPAQPPNVTPETASRPLQSSPGSPSSPSNPEATATPNANANPTPPSNRAHSPLKVSVVKALARLMGYNSKSVTAIRETSNMCGGVVSAVSRDHEYWYDECGLPATYQTFFQLHLLYVLILITRLRALPNASSGAADVVATTTTAQTYQTELLTHFFALAENQMRLTLGRNERERTVRKYMQEMGQQWKGAGVSFDYALARGQANLPTEAEVNKQSNGDASQEALEIAIPEDGGDAELASWVWRNLFSADGAPGTAPQIRPRSDDEDVVVGDKARSSDVARLGMAVRLAEIVAFIRRELARLERIPHERVMNGDVGVFGSVRGD